MGKVVIAAGGSALARVIIDKLVADDKHDILALVRSDINNYPSLPRVTWAQTTYEDKAELAELFRGAIAVLSFVGVLDPEAQLEKRLVDAAVEAGVPRFAPSEWAMGKNLETAIVNYSWYAGKLAMREYLRELNANGKVIEYCLFQPGIFLEFLSWPHRANKHIAPLPGHMLIEEHRIIAMEGHMDDEFSLTSVEDIAAVVAGALDYKGEWPVYGGISGQRLTYHDVQRIGEKVRGKSFQIDLVKKEDLEANVIKVDGLRTLEIRAIPKDQWESFTKIAIIGTLLSIHKGGWNVPGTWNELLPELKFVQLEELAQRLWGKQ
ncbi:uncharacterized protein B0I36DRAFT_135365 [Microdochium trichocladiopsis]|uniref:NmrA-like domain-containing protein n=1 Tax=Microdochium trichocladiopsis TaxID=1682393 RepID=A0A9P9BQ34_9PEZI|nr:uncharacterized protein B0I36DRAFT_135365 [Microdochium trichocladiopsis]KAH7029800.1 hypothetical protein B0I36DRAFT_135365 [Microdochium trichocladiopsis]